MFERLVRRLGAASGDVLRVPQPHPPLVPVLQDAEQGIRVPVDVHLDDLTYPRLYPARQPTALRHAHLRLRSPDPGALSQVWLFTEVPGETV